MRTDTQPIGFKIGELDGKDSERAQRLAGVMNDVAGAKVTTNLYGERWSKLTVNCMANPIAGLSGLGSAEVRSVPGPARVAIQVAAEAITVGRARGVEAEPIYGIDTHRFVDAAAGRRTHQLLPAQPARAAGRARGRSQGAGRWVSVDAAGRDAGPPHRDRLPERLRRRPGPAGEREDAVQRDDRPAGAPARGRHPEAVAPEPRSADPDAAPLMAVEI